jgi:deoxyribonuclease IV
MTAKKRPRLGAHMSIAGGVEKALERGASVGCETIQLFTKNNNQWRAQSLEPAQIARFQTLRAGLDIHPVFAHDSYLINLASPDDELWQKSVDAFTIELERCEALDLAGLVMHPGSHTGSGDAAGIRRVADGLSEVFRRLPGHRAEVWLETTAGQGTSLGRTFEQLQQILEGVGAPERIGVCLDTAHVLAAGYELRTPAGYAATFEAFDRHLGLERLRAFHLNDSKKAHGSRVDRHAHIGQGFVGLDAFRMLVNDARFVEVPMVLETPKGKEMTEDVENLRILRSLFE